LLREVKEMSLLFLRSFFASFIITKIALFKYRASFPILVRNTHRKIAGTSTVMGSFHVDVSFVGRDTLIWTAKV